MRAIPISVAVAVPVMAVAFVCAVPAQAADDPPHRLGDHPAIVVQRLQKTAGYDYASKFYPHPAWLRLYAEPPHEPEPVSVQQSVMHESATPTPPVALKVSAGS